MAAVFVVFNRRRMWGMARVAHVLAILGFLLGLFATWTGTCPCNRVYHLVVLGVFNVCLTLPLGVSRRPRKITARMGSCPPQLGRCWGDVGAMLGRCWGE